MGLKALFQKFQSVRTILTSNTTIKLSRKNKQNHVKSFAISQCTKLLHDFLYLQTFVQLGDLNFCHSWQ